MSRKTRDYMVNCQVGTHVVPVPLKIHSRSAVIVTASGIVLNRDKDYTITEDSNLVLKYPLQSELLICVTHILP
jgi:hypothetical protein